MSTESELFANLSSDFKQIFGQIVSIRVKTLSHTNMVTSGLRRASLKNVAVCMPLVLARALLGIEKILFSLSSPCQDLKVSKMKLLLLHSCLDYQVI